MAISASRVTRFGIGGGIWRPAGDFSTKEPGTPSTPDVEVEVIRNVDGGGGNWPSKQDYKLKKKMQAILEDDEEVLSIIQAAMPQILKFLNK